MKLTPFGWFITLYTLIISAAIAGSFLFNVGPMAHILIGLGILFLLCSALLFIAWMAQTYLDHKNSEKEAQKIIKG